MPTLSAAVLEARGLVKRYGAVEALSGLDLDVRAGEVLGFLGRNGAGKSTAIRIIMGITRPTAGTLRLFDAPAKFGDPKPRTRIGYVAQEQHFYGWMTAVSLGRFVGGFYPTWTPARYDELLRNFDLPIDRRVSTFSGGMVAKLALAIALAHHPPLLILDEPTAGMDPVARREFIEIVRHHARQDGCTTLFSSHLIDEVELAADTVAIVDRGRLLFGGPLPALRDSFRRIVVAVGAAPPGFPPGAARIWQDRQSPEGERVLLVQGGDDAWQMAAASGARLESPSLEDIFIAMVTRVT